MTGRASAAARWREELEAWAIPREILDSAPESPWTFPVELFATRADAAVREPTPTNVRALEALPDGGSVVDVGAGAGAASLPLASKAARITAVDANEEMLSAFAERAAAAGVEFDTVLGRWPDAVARTPVADVVVCNHVFYNVPQLDAFVAALTAHARRRVVVELTPNHPTSDLNPLWLRFHGLARPTGPTAEDAAAVIHEALGIEPHREDWTAPPAGSLPRAQMVAWIRRRLCLSAERDPDVEDAIADRLVEREGRVTTGPRPVVTLWWDGSPG
jgi:SAM-dependent methyltransferase